MLKRLQRGLHDSVILERLGPDAFSNAPASARSDADLVPVGPDANDTDTAATLASEPPPAPARPAQPETVAVDQISRAFGDGVVSQKPLDEVVLEYLVENARKRKRRGK